MISRDKFESFIERLCRRKYTIVIPVNVVYAEAKKEGISMSDLRFWLKNYADRGKLTLTHDLYFVFEWLKE
ncbi:MAG: hypothetical protein ACTSVE_00170 [Candidatus Helarchaeota archaeon]